MALDLPTKFSAFSDLVVLAWELGSSWGGEDSRMEEAA